MGAYGLIAAACWWTTRGYAIEDGGTLLWGVATVTSLGYIALGALLWFRGRRWQSASRNYAAALVVAGFVLPNILSKPSSVSALTIVTSASLLVLLWGRAGKVRAAIGFCALALGVLLLVVGTAHKLRRSPMRGPPVVFEVMRVDDETDLFGTADALPSGASFQTETVEGRPHRYVRFSAPAGATFATVRQRGDAWVKEHLHVQPGVRIAWGTEPAEAGMVLRSYSLREPAFITSADVKDTHVATDKETQEVYIAVTLGTAGAERLRDITREHKGRRLAILFDGGVQVAPVVRSEIAGGHVSITLGHGATPEEAEALATGLRGELLHGP